MASGKTRQAASGHGAWPTRAQPLDASAIGHHQREKISAAMVDLVTKRGYADTSVERICKKAGVSFPTFRKHFRDKEECFLAAFDASVEGAIGRVEGALEAAGSDWAARVIAGLDAVLTSVAEHPAEARVCLVEVFGTGPAGIDRYEEAVRRFIPWLREGRRQMKDSSGLPELLEETILGGVAWAIHQKVALGGAAEVGELRRGLLGTLLRPYLGEERTEELIEREVTQGPALDTAAQ